MERAGKLPAGITWQFKPVNTRPARHLIMTLIGGKSPEMNHCAKPQFETLVPPFGCSFQHRTGLVACWMCL
jgi:hypothetical protein